MALHAPSLRELDESYFENEELKHYSWALIYESTDIDCIKIRDLLEDMGYSVAVVKSEQEVLEAVCRIRPTLVFFNLNLELSHYQPILNGIKQYRDQDGLAPYIFLTGDNKNISEIKPQEQGNLFDNICLKPYNHFAIKAALKNRDMLLRLEKLNRSQSEKLTQYALRLEQEMDLADNIFNNFVRSYAHNPGNIEHLNLPLDVLSGDIFLTAFKPTGHQVVLVGDLTGHGLIPAVGALIVYDIFYSMVNKGFSLKKIASEMNNKLWRTQNTGRFMCACLIELNNKDHFVKILNAGLPNVILHGSKSLIKEQCRSENLPLGVLSPDEVEFNIYASQLQEGDRIYVYTDGLSDIVNQYGEMLGHKKIREILSEEREDGDYYQAILDEMYYFKGNTKANDDITLVEITCNEKQVIQNKDDNTQVRFKPATHWSLTMDIGTDLLNYENPLPAIMQTVTETQGLHACREQIYTLLAEMLSNALEHGVLRLDSEMKKDVDGFARYYELRQQRLQELEQTDIHLEIKHEPFEQGGKLTLRTEYKGKGFDYQKYLKAVDDNEGAAYGRGLKLIRNISNGMRYSKEGCSLEVDYIWG